MAKMYYTHGQEFDYASSRLSLLGVIFCDGSAIFAKMAASAGGNGTTEEKHNHGQQFFRARSQ